MGAVDRREKVTWDLNPGIALTDIDKFSVEKIPTEKIYDNCTFLFRSNEGATTVTLGFLIGPTSYTVSMGNNFRPIKTTKGNQIQRAGTSPGQLSLNLVLIDSGEISERLIFLDTMIKANGDYYDSAGGFQSLYGMSIKIEGVQYFGYCTSFSFSKDSSNAFIYYATVAFEFFNMLVDTPTVPDGIPLKRNAFDSIKKVENYSFEIEETDVTDEDSLIEDSTLKDTISKGLREVSKIDIQENGIAKVKAYSFDTAGTSKFITDLEGKVYVEVGDIIQVQNLDDISVLGPFKAYWGGIASGFVVVPKSYLKTDGGSINQSSSVYYFVQDYYLTNIEDRAFEDVEEISMEDAVKEIMSLE